jgi:hypothetical protein
VERLLLHPGVKGSSRADDAGTEREKRWEKVFDSNCPVFDAAFNQLDYFREF